MISDAVLDRAFKGLTVEERSGLLENAERRIFGPGEIIVEEGASIDSFFVVAKGEVRVTRHIDGTVSAEFVGPRGPGETLGEMSFVDGLGASATLIADGDVEIIAIPSAEISKMVEADPSFAGRFYYSLLHTMCRRLRDTNARVVLPSS